MAKLTWRELLEVVRSYRRSLAMETANFARNLNFCCASNGNVRLYALGKSDLCSVEPTLVYCDLPPTSNAATDSLKDFTWRLVTENLLHKNTPVAKLSRAEELLQERMRIRCLITDYDIDTEAETLLWCMRGDVYRAQMDYLTDSCDVQLLKLPSQIGMPMHVTLCPVNSNIIAFIFNGDIFLQYKTICKQVTFAKDKFSGAGFAGSPAFIYEEEFDRFKGFWWQPTRSQDKIYLLYEETDERHVECISIGVPGTLSTDIELMRYPLAGHSNAISTIRLLEITIQDSQTENENDEKLAVNDLVLSVSLQSLFPWAEYIVRVGWMPNSRGIWLQLMNRLQTHLALVYVPLSLFENPSAMETDAVPSTEPVSVLYEEKNDVLVNHHDHLYFLNNAGRDTNEVQFIWLSEESGFAHLYLVTSQLDSRKRSLDDMRVIGPTVLSKIALTTGEWAVSKKDKSFVHENSGLVYFVASKDTCLESHVYVTNYKRADRSINRLTVPNYSHCLTDNAVRVSPCGQFLVDVCSNFAEAPHVVVYRLSAPSADDALPTASVLAKICPKSSSRSSLARDNACDPTDSDLVCTAGTGSDSDSMDSNDLIPADDTPQLDPSQRPLVQPATMCPCPVVQAQTTPEIFEYKSSKSGFVHYAALFRPVNCNPGERYPTILYVYGGPHVQQVRKVMQGSRLSCLALTQLGYCVVVVDNRGSDNRGLAFETAIKHKMGTIEVEDQVEGLMHVAQVSGNIDLERVACWGWSYGGYMSLLLLAQRPDVFKVALSGAPVTSWHLYDTGYTERYMGLPDEQTAAYANGSVVALASKFPDEPNRLLILHGLNDENVHFTHTAALISASTQHGKPYSLQIYPSERHSSRSSHAAEHLQTAMLHFITENL